MQLIAIRHGVTPSNIRGVLQGQRINDSLTEEAREESQALAGRLLTMGIDAMYSSHLLRAYETAEILSRGLQIPITSQQNLAERDFGSLSGLTWQEAMEKNCRSHTEDKGQTTSI